MFTVTFDTDNDAFAGDPAAEVARILRGITDRVEGWDGDTKFQTIFDVNGNDVGRWKLEADLDGAGDGEGDESTDTEPCEECGNDIPVSVEDEVNLYHRGDCSLHPNNVDWRPEDDEVAILRMASANNPDLAFTADGSDAPERPQF